MLNKNQPRLASRAKWAYEKGRVLYTLKFHLWTLLVVLLAVLANHCNPPPLILLLLLLGSSSVGLWWGKDMARGVRHGLLLGSIALLMPLLSPLMTELPGNSHVLLCLLIGTLASVLLGKMILDKQRPAQLSLTYLVSCFVMALITSSLCCLSMGIGGTIGFALGIAMLPCSRFFMIKITR